MATVDALFAQAANQQNIQTRPSLAVKLEPPQLRPIAFRVFTKKYGLTLKSDALALLAQHVGHRCGATWRATCEPVLDEIAKSWKRLRETEPIVAEAGLAPIIRSLNVPHAARPATLAREETLVAEAAGLQVGQTLEKLDRNKYLQCIDAFTQPQHRFVTERALFEQLPAKEVRLLADITASAQVWLDRYAFLKARILRHASFQTRSFANQQGAFHKLTTIKNLLGRQGGDFMLFGLLVTGADGSLHLEDPDDQIKLDLTEATFGGGWFVPGCFVLVDGHYKEDGVFLVDQMGQPPNELREQSRNVYAGFDVLGVGIERSQERHLLKAEQSYKDAKIVFCSDVRLDDIRSMKTVKQMLGNYEVLPVGEAPLAIVLMGNFISHPHHTNGFSATYKALWDRLATMLEGFPKVCAQSKFIFIPGSNDPWSLAGTVVLPRQPIPKSFLNRVARAVKDVTLATNPCRLSYFTQEIVICREDWLERFRRQSVATKAKPTPRADDEDEAMADETQMDTPVLDGLDQISQTLVRTILDQSTLSPFSQSTRPTYPGYSASLRLFPLPNVLVLADGALPSFQQTYSGCLAMSPGPMAQGKDGTWIEYWPAEKSCVEKKVYVH
ncbi:DNA polymerase epsilon catalytic subunit B, Dpb2 [Protomyces lactucae-debilis]|uniref:DNA polymerase epsilon subunit B n=1 Tax=Protomyces lactucae-debilis TaxID=2754530 RepID=A0A1Y2FLU3_PROLT|nr:DNA polymerase epsilon catalytic subunit B, Dpb2 [Protomyces lactucae-debilis]ORY84334.1 DNA polymerase epsilon catalytic subunit B, Dpb2 [Protomyces lactucae-debilis]